MSHSVLSSFDPLATHPFTNNSSAPSSSPPRPPDARPQPKRAAPAPSAKGYARHGQPAPKPIFVPFRPDRSSPDLEDILLKKKFADAFQGKAAWGIDQVGHPIASSGRQGKAQ
ncbi:uncharacterized protein BXZ73DRAFT_103664 [Epithele typhae]|uniref:uncharacterized protein n=1 Tax=Epithele typhae TaxID=378194 RepID=UPI0020077576|nr:uncharacterized protein BXZ73DRAFT_103664 [Epithele typhae]KAH9923930.1 hypothetical protein BXZ73DRAFT_103664 [Epithele typhae]